MAETKAKKPLKIMFYCVDGVGHLNACIGLAQALAKRGHEIVFLHNPMLTTSVEKYGFKEIILKSDEKNKMMEKSKKRHEENGDEKSDEDAHPLKAMEDELEKILKSGMISGKTSIEKLEEFDPENKEHWQYTMYQEMKEIHPQIIEAIEKEKPDLIIVDHLMMAPCIAYGKIPWAMSFSGNPAFFFESHPDLPPIMSGYPSNDRSKWDEFRTKFDNTIRKELRYYQNKLNKDFGYPEVGEDHFLFKSPYMNIYGYPEELDYTDIMPLPENYVRMDAFCLELPEEKFELPEEFKAKIKPGDKLIYFSLGSFGSSDVDLMKKIIGALAKLPHKVIVSKGAFHDQFELPDNMWGQAFLPQTKILPLVDMVITHGGNNTVTESFTFGKPMLVLPLFVDQFDNAQRILEKGYGYRLDTTTFKDEELIELVEKILNDKDLIERCKKASERIRSSNSKEKACEKIEKIMENLSSSKSD